MECGILDKATDWKVCADLPNMRTYLDIIKKSNSRPDMVLVSGKRKTVVLIELTVPFESNMTESHEFRVAKYEDLTSELHKTQMFAVEVGAHGMVRATPYSLLK